MVVRTLLLVSGLSLLLLGLFHSLAPNRYAAIARVKINSPNSPTNYDPYFIQTELERIKSEEILGKVKEQFGLRKNWGKEPQNPELLALHPGRGGRIIEIIVRSGKPDDAAKIANAIAAAGQKYHQMQGGASWELVDAAVPPTLPFFPNHYLGMASLLAGGLLLAGWWYVGTWIADPPESSPIS